MNWNSCKPHPNFDRQIAVIMRDFNFARVHRCIVAMEWKWICEDDTKQKEIPSLERIKRSLFRSLEHAVSNYKGDPSMVYCGAGGFEVTMDQDHNLQARFQIEGGRYIPKENGDIDFFGLV